MKLKKSNSINYLNSLTTIKGERRNKSTEMVISSTKTTSSSSSSAQSNDYCNCNKNDEINVSKSSYSSTSSSSSVSTTTTNDCLINYLNKFSLNETVNENNKNEIDSQSATPPSSSSTNPTDNESIHSSINPIKLNSLYKIQEKIRSGGFGDVFKGIRKFDNLPIAIKIIRKEKINQWSVNVISIILYI
jgi:hypothetical protein